MKIAKECIKESMKPIAFDANLAQKYKDAPPVMETRLKRYLKLKEALEYEDNQT